jgi:hypothetical protein
MVKSRLNLREDCSSDLRTHHTTAYLLWPILGDRIQCKLPGLELIWLDCPGQFASANSLLGVQMIETHAAILTGKENGESSVLKPLFSSDRINAIHSFFFRNWGCSRSAIVIRLHTVIGRPVKFWCHFAFLSWYSTKRSQQFPPAFAMLTSKYFHVTVLQIVQKTISIVPET